MESRTGSARDDLFLPKRMRIDDLPGPLRINTYNQRNGGCIYGVMSALQSGGGVKGMSGAFVQQHRNGNQIWFKHIKQIRI